VPGQNFIDESHEVLKFLQKRATLDGSRGELGCFVSLSLRECGVSLEGVFCGVGGAGACLDAWE